MARNLTFWSMIIGFLAGFAFNLSDKLAQKLSESVPSLNALMDYEYRALAIIVPSIILLGVIFYFAEKQENEKNEHNQDIYYQAINKWAKNVEDLINEIRQDRNERNSK